MRYLIIITVFLLLPNIFFAQQTYVPDDNLEQALIDEGFDSPPLNDSVPTANIDTVTVLYVSSKNISDLTGIEDFKALLTLYCGSNNLTSLDINYNTALKYLYCFNNDLTSLDLRNNSALQELVCIENNLISLDLGNNSALEELYCDNNDLTSIDLRNNKALELLYCTKNKLTSLDLRNNTVLLEVRCYQNDLTSIDLRNNPALYQLGCDKNNFTSIDLGNNTALEWLNCSENELTYLDLSNNTALKWLWCWDNDLTSLDLSNNPTFLELWCYQNELTSLDLSNNHDLEGLSCHENELTSLDIKNGNNKNMTGGGSRDYFDASNNPDLYCIQVDDSAWSVNNKYWLKDDHAVYSEDCTKVGVEDLNTFEPEISIFPNPADKNFTISFELETPETISMTLTDLYGKELQEFSLEHKQFVNKEIDVSGLSSGVYFLRIDFGSGTVSKKIVVE